MTSCLPEWMTSPFSAIVTFKKQFVDDVSETVKHQRDRFDRRAREMQDRAIQLHLDELEEQYLCCVCGRSGDSREDDEEVYDTFSLLVLPPRRTIEELGRQIPATDVLVDGEPSISTAAGPSPRNPERALIQSDSVSTAEVHNLMYKIRHAVLKKESRRKRRATAVHRDRGLTMLDDSEIDTFSRFFQRPVRGYLCDHCHSCAKRRLDALTQQIQSILFKGQNPILRKVQESELMALSVTGQQTSALIHDIMKVKTRTRGKAAASKSDPLGNRIRPASRSSASDPDHQDVLSEACIVGLRRNIKCGICLRRPCSFFVRQSVAFVCQFCCARDRYYRDNAVCINDELLPADCVHLLTELHRYHDHANQTHCRSTHATLAKARTDLFGPVVAAGSEGNLFEVQHPAVVHGEHRATEGEWAPVPPPAEEDRREAARSSMVSLFQHVGRAQVDLFAQEMTPATTTAQPATTIPPQGTTTSFPAALFDEPPVANNENDVEDAAVRGPSQDVDDLFR